MYLLGTKMITLFLCMWVDIVEVNSEHRRKPKNARRNIDSRVESIAVSQLRVCIFCRLHLKTKYITRRLSQFEGSSKSTLQMQPSFTSFLRMHHYCPSQPPIFFVRPKKKKERGKKMATSRGIDRHFHGPG